MFYFVLNNTSHFLEHCIKEENVQQQEEHKCYSLPITHILLRLKEYNYKPHTDLCNCLFHNGHTLMEDLFRHILGNTNHRLSTTNIRQPSSIWKHSTQWRQRQTWRHLPAVLRWKKKNWLWFKENKHAWGRSQSIISNKSEVKTKCERAVEVAWTGRNVFIF